MVIKLNIKLVEMEGQHISGMIGWIGGSSLASRLSRLLSVSNI